jgi:pilus assembly protein CpaB
MGKWKAIIPLLIAVLIAGSGSLALFKFLKRTPAATQAINIEVETVPVVVATTDLAWGTKLTAENVKTIDYIPESLPPGHFDKAETLNGRIMVASVKQNEAILESKLAPESLKVGGVSAVLKPGKRAIAVKGDRVIGLGGLIKPGNIVDVFVTIKNPENKLQITKLVLEKILVLATGVQVTDGNNGAQPVDVYTLEVTPHDGEMLALASTKGRLQLALRNITDTETILTKGATIEKTLASLSVNEPDPPPPTKKKIRTVKARTFTMEVIQNGKVNLKKLAY